MSDELKPCPFCGSTDLDPDDRFGGPYPFAVCCWPADGGDKHDCQDGFVGPAGKTREAAIAAWNTRPRERTPAEEAVIRAAVAMVKTGAGQGPEAAVLSDTCVAVHALLAAQPEWKP